MSGRKYANVYTFFVKTKDGHNKTLKVVAKSIEQAIYLIKENPYNPETNKCESDEINSYIIERIQIEDENVLVQNYF